MRFFEIFLQAFSFRPTTRAMLARVYRHDRLAALQLAEELYRVGVE